MKINLLGVPDGKVFYDFLVAQYPSRVSAHPPSNQAKSDKKKAHRGFPETEADKKKAAVVGLHFQ